MKYKVGDRVRIVSETTEEMNWTDEMDVYLGRVMTIKNIISGLIFGDRYKMAEDDGEYYWDDSMIAGLASETPFDFSAWKYKNVCMHCKSREEAEDFCNEMHKAGLTWSNGRSYLPRNYFEPYEEQTCYCFNKGKYNSIVCAKDKGYTILEWSDYRSTEPPKGEQEKIMGIKIDSEPLSYQEAAKIKQRICNSYICANCPLGSKNNGLSKGCFYAFVQNPKETEEFLKQWTAERPTKTNRDKFVEVFGEIKRYGKCEIIDCSTVPCLECGWWNREYVEPDEAKVE